MLTKMRKNFMNQKGFTLVELIVVIAILGILAAIAVPRLSGFTSKAEEQADKVTATTVKNAVAIAVANKDIEVSGTGTITYTSGTYEKSNITKPVTNADLTTLMESLVGKNIELKGNMTKIVVTITADEVTAVLEK